MKKRKTNVQAITHMMNYSVHGALAQAFIMNAVSTAADAIVAGGAEALAPDGWVAPDKWIAVATEIQNAMKAHFKAHFKEAA